MALGDDLDFERDPYNQYWDLCRHDFIPGETRYRVIRRVKDHSRVDWNRWPVGFVAIISVNPRPGSGGSAHDNVTDPLERAAVLTVGQRVPRAWPDRGI